MSAPAASLPRKRLPHRAAVLLLALLLHAVPVWMLMRPPPTRPAGEHQDRRLLVQLIAEPRPQRLPQPQTQMPERAPGLVEPVKTVRPRPATVARPAPRPAEQDTAQVTITAAVPADAAASAVAPQAAASAPWLDPEKTLRVLRMHAAQVPITEQAALASQAPGRLTSSQRLGNEVQQAAIGDCLKGEFAGAGLGILSAPFWLLAEARGKCRR